MLKGFYLTLMIGPVVPIPVSQAVLDSLTSVEVVTTAGTTSSGFELNFTMGRSSILETLFLLVGGASIPLVWVVIVVTVNGTPEMRAAAANVVATDTMAAELPPIDVIVQTAK